MISSFYAGLLTLLIVWLSLNVIRLRRSKNISLGDGGEAELQTAIRAQGNAVEYIPIAMILLVLLELNHAHLAVLHLGGMAIVAGRLIHARGLLSQHLGLRVLGMKITFFTLMALALINLGYFVYASLPMG